MDNIDDLCRQWLALKEQERVAREARHALEEKMLPFVQSKDSGTVHAKGEKFFMTVEFSQKPDGDFAQLWNTLPELSRSFVLMPKYEYSKTGYNTAMKHLTFLGTTSEQYRKERETLEAAVKELVKWEPEKPSFSVRLTKAAQAAAQASI